LAGELKELRRTIALEIQVSRYAVKAPAEIAGAYKETLVDLEDHAPIHRASMKTLHNAPYSRFRERCPWLPTMSSKGCMRYAARIARSFGRVKPMQHTREIAWEIIGLLDLNPRRREDRETIKELWDLIYRTARKISITPAREGDREYSYTQ